MGISLQSPQSATTPKILCNLKFDTNVFETHAIKLGKIKIPSKKVANLNFKANLTKMGSK